MYRKWCEALLGFCVKAQTLFVPMFQPFEKWVGIVYAGMLYFFSFCFPRIIR